MPVFIIEGVQIGDLTIGEVIHNKSLIPPTTKDSYLRMGEVRMCQCSCGAEVVYPSILLAKGSIKSCGCKKAAAMARRQAMRDAVERKRFLKKFIQQAVIDLKLGNFASEADLVTAIKNSKRELDGLMGRKSLIIGPNGKPL